MPRTPADSGVHYAAAKEAQEEDHFFYFDNEDPDECAGE